MKPKELMHFIQSLWNRGLLSQSPEEFDYERVIWDYKRINSGKPVDIKPTPRITHCAICGKIAEENTFLCFEHHANNTFKPPAPPEDRRLPEGGPIKPPRN